MDGDFSSWREFTFWWLAALFASTVVVVARLGVMLFGKAVDPPEDPMLERHWARRRRWIAIGEIAALPAFATVSIVLVSYYQLNPVAGVLLAIAQGFIGFPLLLDGAAWLFRKRLGMPNNDPPGAENGGGNA